MAAAAASARPRIAGKQVLSGIQPSGIQHLGNYFGAVRQFIALQEENRAAYFMADLHSLTSIRDAKQRRELTRAVALDDPGALQDLLLRVSRLADDLPEVTELDLDLGGAAVINARVKVEPYQPQDPFLRKLR